MQSQLISISKYIYSDLLLYFSMGPHRAHTANHWAHTTSVQSRIITLSSFSVRCGTHCTTDVKANLVCWGVYVKVRCGRAGGQEQAPAPG